MVDATARKLLIPGAVVLLRTPQGNFTVTYGTTNLGTTSPPSADTHFRIASNTKTMTAAVTVQLAQEGKLKFSDPVSKYVAGVPNGDHITIAELLEMRSGLYNYLESPKIAATADSGWPRECGCDCSSHSGAAHRAASKQCDRTAKTVLPRIYVRQCLGRLHGDAAVFDGSQGRGSRGHPFADGLHEPEHHLWLGGRRRRF
jgi:hypothetical protein